MREFLPAACGILFMLLYMLVRRKTAGGDMRGWLRIASDAAMIPGAVLTALGVLALIAGSGFFDGIRYSVLSFFNSARGERNKYATYYDYMNRKKKRREWNFLLIAGIVQTLLAFLLASIYALV